MADETNATESGILNATAEQTDDAGFKDRELKPKDYEPVYKMVGDARIPTSKQHGKLWKSRKDAAEAKMKKLGMHENWDECIRYYKNDQSKTRGQGGSDQQPYRRPRSTRIGQPTFLETENIVFANTSALVPSLYAKNPTCDVTPNIRDDDKDDPASEYNQLNDLSRVAKRLVNAVTSMKASPGINLKPKARKAVIMTTLTNIAYIELGYTKRDNSSSAALNNMQDITKRLAEAKDQNEIIEIEGELQAIENKIDFLNPSGPYVKFRHPRDVLIDPDADEADGTDAKWMMVADYVSTAFINAVYREKKGKGDDEEWHDIYQPTHVIGIADTNSIQDDINAFSLIGDEKNDYKSFGYGDDKTYRNAQRTKVWYVWDKVTRRVFMYNDGDWKWPIWVWDDPLQLDRFFPIYGLQFYTDPEDNIGPSEVMMYLDQQDAINTMNGEMARMRQRAISNVFYNKTLIKDPSVVDKFLGGESTDGALGVELPPEADISKVFFAALPPSAAFMELFKKDSVYASIDKVSSVTGVMQGQQFKTNTTNQAINTYNSQTQTRLDEKIDAVEDFIGDIMWGVMQLCLQNMSQDEVAGILGDEDAQIWRQMEPEEIRKSFSITLTGGSLQKPTSQIKKQEAIQIGQVLGQYANAGGGAAIMIMLKALERAFDDVVITDEDWKTLEQAVVQNLQRGQSGGQGQPAQGQQAPTPQSSQQSPQGGQPSAGETSAAPQQIMQILQAVSSLPPQIGQAIGSALQQGVPLPQVIQQVMQTIQSQSAQAPQQ